MVKTQGTANAVLANTWLILVDGDSTDAQEAIDAMGRFGAIRSHFFDEYEVKPAPLDGLSSEVYEVIPRSRRSPRFGLSEGGSAGLAVKLVASSSLTSSKNDELAAVRREVSMLAASQGHPNIVGFCGLFRYDDKDAALERWGIVMHYYHYDLFSLITARPLREEFAQEVSIGILHALKHLHSRGIVHRDIKPESILLKPCGQPVLSCFGIAMRVDDCHECKQYQGTLGYAAPELLLRTESKCCTTLDMFSFGVLIHFSLCGNELFRGGSSNQVCRRTIRCKVDFKSSVPVQISDASMDFVRRLVRKSPHDRLSASRALRHPWIVGFDANECGNVPTSPFASRGKRFGRRAGITCTNPDDVARRLMAKTLSTSLPDVSSSSTCHSTSEETNVPSSSRNTRSPSSWKDDSNEWENQLSDADVAPLTIDDEIEASWNGDEQYSKLELPGLKPRSAHGINEPTLMPRDSRREHIAQQETARFAEIARLVDAAVDMLKLRLAETARLKSKAVQDDDFVKAHEMKTAELEVAAKLANVEGVMNELAGVQQSVQAASWTEMRFREPTKPQTSMSRPRPKPGPRELRLSTAVELRQSARRRDY